MKVYHVIDSGGMYGAEVMLLDLMREQQAMGHMPVLCSIGAPGCDDKAIETSAREQGLKVELIRMRAGLNLTGALRLVNMAHQEQVDLFHCHGYKADILLGLIPKKIRKIPRISTLHGWTNTKSLSKMAVYEWLHVKSLKYSDAVVLVNAAMRHNAKLCHAGIDSNKMHVIRNGIQLEQADTGNKDAGLAERLSAFKAEGILIGTAGRLSREKGYDYLLKALALVREQRQDVKLVIFGAGHLLQELTALAHQLGLTEHVLFTGYISNARLYFSQLDIFVLSSLSEGLPITLLEAMAENIPVVATAVGGIPEVLDNGKSGVLVETENPEQLSAAFLEMIENPTTARMRVERAVDRVRTDYSSATMARSYMEIYAQLLPIKDNAVTES